MSSRFEKKHKKDDFKMNFMYILMGNWFFAKTDSRLK